MAHQPHSLSVRPDPTTIGSGMRARSRLPPMLSKRLFRGGRWAALALDWNAAPARTAVRRCWSRPRPRVRRRRLVVPSRTRPRRRAGRLGRGGAFLAFLACPLTRHLQRDDRPHNEIVLPVVVFCDS